MSKVIIILNVFATVISSVLFMMSTRITQYLIDTPRLELVFLLAIVLLLSMIVGLLKSHITQRYFYKKDKIHLEMLFEKIDRLPYSFLETKEYADDYNEIKMHMEREWISALCVVITAGCYCVGLYFLVMNQLSAGFIVILFLILMIFIFVSWLASTKLSKLMYAYWKEYIKNTRKYKYHTGVLTENYSYKDKKIFDFPQFFEKAFDDEFDVAAEKNRALGKKRIKLECIIDVMFFGYILISFFLLLYSYEYYGITAGLFISIIGYLISLSDKIVNAIKSLEVFFRYKSHKKKINDFMNKRESENIINRIDGDIEDNAILQIKNLFFRYPNSDKLILKNINISFEKGKKYAIVGVNGSGKTTLVKLLLGLYNPVTGNVFCNKIPVALFQDFNRYPMTLSENITLGNVRIDDENTIDSVVKATGLENRVAKMKKGVDTELTILKDDGEDLSGGEWQRVGLARILCAESDIYILDEPTASLDPLEEIRIFNTYNQLLTEKTVIYITHRLGFVKNVDEVIVLDNGTIAEKGSHKELLELENGIYKRMYEEQKSWYE